MSGSRTPLQQEIDHLISLAGSDFVAVDNRESSMLPLEIADKVRDVIYPEIKKKYKDKFDQMGGTDGVLKKLENIIEEKINEGIREKNSKQKTLFQNTPTFVYNIASKTPLLASGRAKYAFGRQGFEGDDGLFKTALRALNDRETISWASLLHKGADSSYHGIKLREMLAYYWLAASDPQMELAKVFTPEVHNEEEKKAKVKESIYIFICVLAEIRRAHNEDNSAKSLKDNPSCDRGTYGRIASRSAPMNKVSAFKPSPFLDVANEIRNFIRLELKDAEIHVRAAINRFYEVNIMGNDDVKELLTDKETLNTFIKSVLPKREELITYLKKNLEGLASELNDKNGVEAYESIEKITDLILDSLKLESSINLIDSPLLEGFLNDCGEILQQDEAQRLLQSEITAFRVLLWETHTKLTELKRLQDNEIIRGLLNPSYLESKKAQQTACVLPRKRYRSLC